MPRALWIVPCLALSLAAAEPPAMEVTRLPAATDAKAWYTAECTVTDDATHLPPGTDVKTAIRWHIDVDWTTGEKAYPIGWPRCGVNFKPVADWSGYDYLSFMLYADTSRPALPAEAAGLGISMPDRNSAYNLPLKPIKGRWVEVKIPIENLLNPRQVASLQWHISESQYKHLDKVDYWIADLKLSRYTRPAVLEFAPLERVLTADAGYVALDVHVAGLAPDAVAKGRAVLRAGGKEVCAADVALHRGRQRLTIPVAALPAGPALVAVQLEPGRDAAIAPLTIVAGPFGKD